MFKRKYALRFLLGGVAFLVIFLTLHVKSLSTPQMVFPAWLLVVPVLMIIAGIVIFMLRK